MEIRHTILVVDDTPENIDILVGMLSEDYKVKAAPNGERALKTASKNPPDLILLDIMMPIMDGFETCSQLKASPETRQIPVIFLTAKVETEDIVKGFELGAVDYVTKPFNPIELKARITTHLNLKLAQEQLVESEKMASLGQLVAGIAHEINTPFGVIHSAIHHLTQASAGRTHLPALTQQLAPEEQTVFYQLLKKADASSEKLSTREERQHRRTLSAQLTEKGFANASQMATKLVDIGILKNVASYERLLQTKQVETLLEIALSIKRQRESLEDMQAAVERISKLIFSLKNYARKDLSGGQQTEVRVADTLETVLALYHNQIKQGIEVIKDYQDVPLISGYEDELIQVWTNLIHNALQAMHYQGTLEIHLLSKDSQVMVEVIDSGSGIPQDIQQHIFKPFYTTKPAGEGTGLGLEIVQRIVDKHKGTLHFTSRPGRTAFTVCLPL